MLPLSVIFYSDPRARTIEQRANGTLPLTDGEGSVGDPASESVLICCSVSQLRPAATRWLGLGQAVLLRNYTRADNSDTRFSTAAGEQLGYLLDNASRADSGAISHRENEVALWCVLRTWSILSPFRCPVYGRRPLISAFCASRNPGQTLFTWHPPSSRTLVRCRSTAGGLRCCRSRTIRFGCIAMLYSTRM